MNILTLISIEFKKIRRSHILPVLLAAVLILWVFSVAHADTHFDMGDVGISPENSFLVQGFLGMSWFCSRPAWSWARYFSFRMSGAAGAC